MGFEAASLKDPGLNATDEVKKIVKLLDKLETILKLGGCTIYDYVMIYIQVQITQQIC